MEGVCIDMEIYQIILRYFFYKKNIIPSLIELFLSFTYTIDALNFNLIKLTPLVLKGIFSNHYLLDIFVFQGYLLSYSLSEPLKFNLSISITAWVIVLPQLTCTTSAINVMYDVFNTIFMKIYIPTRTGVTPCYIYVTLRGKL